MKNLTTGDTEHGVCCIKIFSLPWYPLCPVVLFIKTCEKAGSYCVYLWYEDKYLTKTSAVGT